MRKSRRLIVLVSSSLAAATIMLTGLPGLVVGPFHSIGPDGTAHLGGSGRTASVAYAQSATSFLETFDGDPGTPQAWQPPNWGVDANNSDAWSGSDPNSMATTAAHHGTDCGAPPATHQIASLPDSVFRCRDHIMTSMAGGYAAAYLTPPALVDFSQGEAIVRFDASTYRTVGRDWMDLWLTPFDDQFTLPLNQWLPPYQGEPQRSVQLKMEGASRFEGYLYSPSRRSSAAKLPVALFDPYENWLANSASVRSTFELRISKTHVKFGMPQYNRWWVDTDFPEPLEWNVAVLQLAQHSYNATKDCTGECYNSFHWDNVSISPSRPMDIVPMTTRAAYAKKDGPDTLTFLRPAPAGSALRFAAVGANIDLSFDGGATWGRATYQPSDRHAPEHFSSYLYRNVPTGATSVKVRATGDSYISTWLMTNAHLMATGSTTAAGPTPTLPATLVPTRTTTPTIGPSRTPTPTPSPTSTVPAGTILSATPTVLSGSSTVTFDGLPGENQSLNGQYPSNVINWGSGQWFLSGPYGSFATKSTSFTGAGRTSASLTFVVPRLLVSLGAYNGGAAAATITLSCIGQPTKSVTLAAKATQTIQTGWTGTCSTVTIGSSSGWDTNFDNLVYA